MSSNTGEPRLRERTLNKVDASFKNAIINMPEGETLKLCFQCGTCSATCPVSRFTDLFRPNKLIQAARLGLKERALKDKTIWLCAACYTCNERCPQGIQVKELMRIFKNLAIKEGYFPKFYESLKTILLQTGLAYRISPSRASVRKSLGLPRLSNVKTADIEKLAEATGFMKHRAGVEET